MTLDVVKQRNRQPFFLFCLLLNHIKCYEHNSRPDDGRLRVQDRLPPRRTTRMGDVPQAKLMENKHIFL